MEQSQMATKIFKELEIAGDEGNIFIIRDKEVGSGKVKEAATYHAEKPMKADQLGAVLAQEYKVIGTRRSAWQSLLGLVMAAPTLDGYKGKGDTKQGKTGSDFKASVRTAEEAVLRHMVDKGQIKLPAVDKEDKA